MKSAFTAVLLMATASFAAAASPTDGIDAAPVNPDATEAAVRLYDYLLDNYGRRVLSGVVSQGVRDEQNVEYVRSVTGRTPLISCHDFMEHYQCAPVNPTGWSGADYANPIPDESVVAAGGIVQYQWHWFVPKGEAYINTFNQYEFYCDRFGSESNIFSAAAAMRPGTWQRRVIDRDIDAIASYFLAMQRSGIAVLWRPLHEAAGNIGAYQGGKAWFWWGNDGAEACKQLWRYMYDRLKAAGVNNLLWVWTASGTDSSWYPGDEYVDIVGVDNYSVSASTHNSLISEWRFLDGITRRKMKALTECGAMPSLDNMAASGDLWSWVAPWNGDFIRSDKYNSQSFLRSQYASDLLVTRETAGDTPADPGEYTEITLWENTSSPALMDWNNIIIEVSADRAACIAVGDRLTVTVSRMLDTGWPKVIYACADGWTDIYEHQVFGDRGMSMPRRYSFDVSASQLTQLHRGFLLRGESCYVSRLALRTRRTDAAEIIAPDALPATVDVYNLQGVCVRRGAPADAPALGLPAGVYIAGGRKISVR
ncbi:MAG: glycoside hydrolase family 26 protein [Bacteroides sp.]|nr:glycoside hydrolase family 26 protein [Bacteroides sp.]MCM1094980.1 glycoside hydrolase family 26 protein [Terasakiella sp.]